MVIDYLNYRQYDTGHSIGNNFEIEKSEWLKQDAWQEWQYLFDAKGGFYIYDVYRKAEFVIPWEITYNIVSSFGLHVKYINNEKEVLFGEMWEILSDRSDDDESIKDLDLYIKIGEVHAFPNQGINGWRNYCKVFVNGEETVGSMFADPKYENEPHMEEKTITTGRVFS